MIRDVERKADAPGEALRQRLDLAKRLFAQQRQDTNKLNALYAPEVECIAKGISPGG